MPANLPTMVKPDIGDEATGECNHGATGVEGDSARGKISQEPGKPARWWKSHSVEEAEIENALSTLAPRVTEKPVVAVKRGNARGAKGL